MHTGVERAASQCFLPTITEDDEESMSVCNERGSITLQVKVEVPEPRARDMSSGE